jgi:Tol biopolymer transport system component
MSKKRYKMDNETKRQLSLIESMKVLTEANDELFMYYLSYKEGSLYFTNLVRLTNELYRKVTHYLAGLIYESLDNTTYVFDNIKVFQANVAKTGVKLDNNF